MKTIILLLTFISGIYCSLFAQDTTITRTIVYDRVSMKGEGPYEGRITQDNRKDSISILTDNGTKTFSDGEVAKVEFNIARAGHNSQMFTGGTEDKQTVQPYAYRPKLVSSEKVRKLKKASIILAALGGGLHVIGFVANASGSVSDRFLARNTLYAIGGISNTLGAAAGIADIGTWIAYAHNLKKYKRQNQSGK